MASFTVNKYTPDQKSLWDTFVTQANNATFLFQRDFMDYHSDRFEDYSLMVFKKEKLIALLPANTAGGVVYSHQGLTYGGLVLAKHTRLEKTIAITQAVLKYLHTEGVSHIEVKLLPSFYHKQQSDEMHYLAFLLEATLIGRESWAVAQPQQSPKLSSSRKEGVKRGQKNGLVVKEEDTLAAFWNNILIPNLQAKHDTEPLHSLSEISLLKERFPKNIRQFNVYHNDTIVGGTTIFETETCAHCQYISGNADKNTLGSLDFLHNILLNDIFKHKPYFDFGTSNEARGKKIKKGLSFWKEGFGTYIVTQDFYRISTAKYKKLNSIFV